jgi:hypothetical protein
MADLSDFDPDALAEDFAPRSVDDANRLLWHLSRATEQVAATRALYDAERARMDAWLAEQTAVPLARIAGLERALEGWARMAHAADPSRKTWDLSSGVIRLRPARASVEVESAFSFVDWALANARLDLLSILPAKSAVAAETRKVDTETEDCTVEVFISGDGETIPGVVSVKAKSLSFTVQVAGDGD